MTLIEQIRENYDNAIKNGYDLNSMSAEAIAAEMYEYSKLDGNYTLSEVERAVEQVRSERLIQG